MVGRNGDTDTAPPGKSPSCSLCRTSLCSNTQLGHHLGMRSLFEMQVVRRVVGSTLSPEGWQFIPAGTIVEQL